MKRTRIAVTLVLFALLAGWQFLQQTPQVARDSERGAQTRPVSGDESPEPLARSESPEPLATPPARGGSRASDALPPARGDASPSRSPPAVSDAPTSLPSFLPREAHDTLALILRGGPYPHRQDGGVFQNRERRLPAQPRGWYREYTVRTPGEAHRGARRIVTGGNPPREFWYTADHYGSFRAFEVPR